MSTTMNDLTLDPAIVELATVRKALEQYATRLVIKNAEGFLEAADRLKGIKAALKDVEAARVRITAPINESLREINAQARIAAQPFLDSEAEIKCAMVAYTEEQDRLRRIAQRKADEQAMFERQRLQAIAAAAAAKGQEAKAERFEDRAQAVVAPVAQQAAPKVAGIATREVWSFRIIDAGKIPPAFLTPDTAKIGGLVRSMKAGARDILGPGVEVYSETTIASRSK